MPIATFWRKHFLILELLLAVALGSVVTVWGYHWGGFEAIDGVLNHNRADVYGVLATIFGSLLGFVIVSISIVVGHAGSDKLRIVRESPHYQTLWDVFIGTTRTLGIGTAVAFAGLIFDRPDDPIRWLLALNVFFVILAAFRLARSVWILEYIVRIVGKKS